MANVTIAPDADTVTVGSWTPSTGATYYATLDEASADDSDFILSGATPSADKIKIRLSDPSGDMNDPMTVAVRCKASAGTINLAIRLVEGTTTIAEWTVTGLASTWTTVTNELTAGERAAISDFTNLFVELEANPAAGPAFLLDTYTGAVFAYSFRKLRTAYAGSAVRIRESGGNTEQDIGFDAEGDFDTAAAATFIGANTGYIVTWYDQSSNGRDLTQATAANQPLYTASGIGALPSATCAYGSTLAGTYTLDTITNCTIFSVLNNTAAGANRLWEISGDLTGIWAPYSNGNLYLDIGSSGANGRINAAAPAGWEDNPHILECYRDSVDNQEILVDGSSVISGTKTDDLAGASRVVKIGRLGDNAFIGLISEIIMWGTDLGATNRAAARGAINTYYSVY